MRIPKKIKLLGHTITVRVVKARDWDAVAEKYDARNAVGLWSPEEQLILIRRGAPSVVQHTYFHELTHAILDMMNDKRSNNESFVDNFSGLLSQAMQSAE